MKLLGLIVLLVLFFVYRLWFSFSGTLSSGDWPYLYLENIEEFPWSTDIRFLWLAPYYQILSKILVQYIGIPWEVVERLFWFWPFLILSVASSYYLTKSFLGVLIYTTNTYILMVIGGGQMGIALSYSVAPFVLKRFINLIDSFVLHSQNIKYPIMTGLILAIQMMFDPRIAYITFLAVVIYTLFNIRYRKLFLTFYSIFIPLGIAIVINLYWIIPLLSGNLPREYQGLGSKEGFEFLSFADFSNAISLLHPNWPENIFGKTYFLQPEFLLLPILAYSGLLLFISNIRNRISKRTILFFTILGLVGAFLAKGANEPFGFLNQWMFEYVPGMSMFRDPSKFYILIVLSYSVLIPFSISNFKLKIHNVFLIFTILYLVFLIRPAIFGQLTGTFKTYQIPQEYIALKEFLKRDQSFSPVLWIPQRQRFGFYSKNHPAFESSDGNLTAILQQQKFKYVIVPFDSQKELFIKNRKYDERLYKKTIEELEETPWISRKRTFGDIVVFEVN